MEASLPWGVQFIGFARPHRFLALEIATVPLMAAVIWIFQLLSPELTWLYEGVLAFTAPTGVVIGVLGGRRVLVNTQRFGYVLPWWRGFGPLGVFILFVPVFVYLAIWFAMRPWLGEATALAAIGVMYVSLGGLSLGHLLGLIGFELTSGVAVWYRTGIEDRKTILGRAETRVFYTRPKGYRPDPAERTFPGERQDGG